jgi:hypothetical protein
MTIDATPTQKGEREEALELAEARHGWNRLTAQNVHGSIGQKPHAWMKS